MDVEADVGHVVEVLAGDEPDDLADLALGVVPGHARKSVRVDAFSLGQLSHIVQQGALGVGKKRAGAVLLEGIEFGLIHRGFDGERAADVDAEKTDVNARHLFANEHDGLRRELQLFVQLADLGIELAEGNRQPRRMHFQRCKHLAELPARKVVRQLHHQALRLLDGWKKCVCL